MKPLVNICMLTYNHEKFIAQAIDSILAQQTNFTYQLIIAEDCSTDNTRQITEKYAEKYPKKIKLLPSDKNYGVIENFIRVITQSTAKYIALCEGDDYWTDPLKLQKQVDFLNTHPHASGCFHDVVNVDENNNIIKENYYKVAQKCYTRHDCLSLLKASYATCSLVFRREAFFPIPEWYYKIASDFATDLLITKKGKLCYIPKNMAAYRIHGGGIWQGKNKEWQYNELINRYLVLLKTPEFEPLKDIIVKDLIRFAINRVYSTPKKKRQVFLVFKTVCQLAFIPKNAYLFLKEFTHSYLSTKFTRLKNRVKT